MADNTNAESVATEDALQEVAALKSRVAHSDAAVEETSRRLAQTAAELQRVGEVAERATAALEQVQTVSKVDTELDTANREMDTLEEQYQEAFTAGDAKLAASLQRKMALTGAKINDLSRVKETPPARPPAATTTDDGSGRVRMTPEQQREAFIATRTPKTAAWLRQHPEFFTDPKVGAKVRAADMDWEADGKAKDTPEYFEHIERRAGLRTDTDPQSGADGGDRRGNGRQPNAEERGGSEGTASALTPAGGDNLPDGRRGPPERGRQRQKPVAAPPTRDGAPNLSGRGAPRGEKRITPEMQQWAAMMYPNGGIDPEEYYDEYQRLVDNGEINDRFGAGR